MATAGRKPKPAAIKRIEGNPGKREIKEGYAGTGCMPECPDWLNDDAKAEWERLACIFIGKGIIDELDMAAFAGYCQSYSEFKINSEYIKKYGATVETPSGYIQQLPQVSIARQNKLDMLKFAAELGLTPSARTRISLVEDKKEENPMAKLLSE